MCTQNTFKNIIHMKKRVTKRQRHDQGGNIATYSTFDLGGTAALLSNGFNLIALDKTNPKRVLFIFEWNYEIEKTANNYHINTLKVCVRTLVDNMKILKNRIYDS
jgi:hypothetical protein